MSTLLTRSCGLGLLLLTLPSTNVFGSQSVDGTFTATIACDAYQSFNKGTNPGAVRTVPGQDYEAREINTASDYAWVRVVIPGVANEERWVPRECGVPHFTVAQQPAPESGNGACQAPNTFDSYVLAVTWQAGFCEHVDFHGPKPECDAMKAGGMAVSNITLHGLWPNKKSCGTKYGLCGGPSLELSEDTISKLAPWMPNFFYEQTFGQHEWQKHGVCQAKGDDEYFLTAVEAVKVVDGSALGNYIHDNIGGTVSVKHLFEIVETEAGAGASKKMTVVCAAQKYLQEIRFGLSTSFKLDAGLGGLLEGGQDQQRVQGCSGDDLVIERSGPG